jgi:hypothetical protein
MRCKICQSPTTAFDRARVLGAYEIQYYSCPACGFIQTEEPYWLDEAYAAPIGAADVGLLSRNIVLSRILKALIERFFERGGQFLDYGGGYGVLVRLMRDQGYDFYRSDPLCPNLFAQGFDAPEGRPAQPPYELVTAFEVAEHLANPRGGIEQMLEYSPNLLLSTLLVPPSRPRPGAWWYYSLQGGQHISLYTRRSLAILAQSYGLRLYTNGTSLHLLTKRRIPEGMFKLISHYRVATLLNMWARRPALTMPDMQRAE